MRPKRLDPAALECLMAYDWRRNNVRELRNAVERMIIAADGDMIRLDDVPTEIRDTAAPGAASPGPAPTSFQALKAEAERQIIVAALERNDWHITRTARALGLADHASLLKIMRRHGLSPALGVGVHPNPGGLYAEAVPHPRRGRSRRGVRSRDVAVV